MTCKRPSRWLVLAWFCPVVLFGYGVMKRGPYSLEAAGPPIRKTAIKVKPDGANKDKDLEKAKADLAAALKELDAAKKALDKNKADLAAALKKLAAAEKTQESLRKELEGEKSKSKDAADKLDAAMREASKAKADLTAANKSATEAKKLLEKSKDAVKKLVEAEKAQEALRKELEAEKTRSKEAVAKSEEAAKKKLAEALTARDRLDKQLKTERSRLEAASRDARRMRSALDETKRALDQKRKAALQPAAPALLVVTLASDATLTVDGNPTTSTGERRVFESPALSQGWPYYYLLVAESTRDGKPVKTSKRIEVRAGHKVEVNLREPEKKAEREKKK
jgi:uncharacterized protein (TIGR03000 family)